MGRINPTVVALWIAYVPTLAAGIVFSMGSAAERITIPQVFAMPLLTCLGGLFVYEGSVVLAIACFLTAAYLFERSMTDPPSTLEDLVAECRREELACRKALKEDPQSVLALERLGDLYKRIGEAAAARRHYDKAMEVYVSRPDLGRMRGLLHQKLQSMTIDPSAEDPRFPSVVRACPACESIASAADYACPRCGEAFFPGRMGRVAVLGNRVFERQGFTRIVASGLAFLPFLYGCGDIAYAFIWSIWSYGFAAWKGGSEPSPKINYNAEAFGFLARMALVAALILGTTSLPKAPLKRPEVRAAGGASGQDASSATRSR